MEPLERVDKLYRLIQETEEQRNTARKHALQAHKLAGIARCNADMAEDEADYCDDRLNIIEELLSSIREEVEELQEYIEEAESEEDGEPSVHLSQMEKDVRRYKARVLQTKKNHPSATSKAIAEHLGITEILVSRILGT